MYSRVSKTMSWVLALAAVAVLPLAMAAQDSAKPATTASSEDSPSKWDIFAGYSYLAPHGTVGANDALTAQSVNYGAILSVARYFNKYMGLQLEADEHINNENQYYPTCPNCGSTWSNDDFSGGGGGLIFRFPTADVTPFVHALIGLEYAGTLHSPVWPIGTKELDRPRTPRGRAQKNNFQRHHPKNTTHANVVTSPPTTSAAGQMKCAFRFGATAGDLRSEFAQVCADLELLRSFIARSSFPSRR